MEACNKLGTQSRLEDDRKLCFSLNLKEKQKTGERVENMR
jgi:hypothetical protein